MGYITTDITWDICWKLKNTQKKVSFPILSRFPKFFLEKLHCAANVFSLYFIWCSVYFNCSVLCCWFACFFFSFFIFSQDKSKIQLQTQQKTQFRTQIWKFPAFPAVFQCSADVPSFFLENPYFAAKLLSFSWWFDIFCFFWSAFDFSCFWICVFICES